MRVLVVEDEQKVANALREGLEGERYDVVVEPTGEGAFFRLHLARRGDRVRIASAGGHTFEYRVVSVRNYLKSALPASVFSRKGSSRLVLVTCGGPFDPLTGHYRDNVVVTAVPS